MKERQKGYMAPDSKTNRKFEGFPPERQTWNFPTPLNGWVHKLTGAEFKVLWYIVRHTFGWQKTGDTISYKQFQQGIQRQDGTWLDQGTGLGRRAIAYSLKKLEEMGFIKRISGSKRGKTGLYKLRFAAETSAKRKLPPCKNETGTSAKRKLTIFNIQSLTRQSLSPYSHEMRERLLSELKKTFPERSFPKGLLLKEPDKVDYLLWKIGKGEIKPHLIKSPLAYIKSLTIDGPFPSFHKREEARKRKERQKEEERRKVEEEMKSIDWEGNRKRLKKFIDTLQGDHNEDKG
jgi:DNA-binding transcriptional ArsR family regulator